MGQSPQAVASVTSIKLEITRGQPDGQPERKIECGQRKAQVGITRMSWNL